MQFSAEKIEKKTGFNLLVNENKRFSSSFSTLLLCILKFTVSKIAITVKYSAKIGEKIHKAPNWRNGPPIGSPISKNRQKFPKSAKLANWRPPVRQFGFFVKKIATLGVARLYVT